MWSRFLIGYLLLAIGHISAEIIPSYRRTTWNPGVQGGIPTYTNIYVMRAPGVTLSQLNTDLQGCPTGGVVLLTNGIYTFSDAIDFGSTANGVVLRGMGTTNTFIRFTANDCKIKIGADPARLNPPYSNNIVSGLTKGSTSIVLSTVANLPALGHIIAIDQLNDGWLVENDLGDGCNYCGRANGERSLCQIVLLTSSNDNTIGFSPPLHMGVWNAALTPQVWHCTDGMSMMCGVESLSITNEGAAPWSVVEIGHARDCWVYDVWSTYNPNYFALMYTSLHCEVRHCTMISCAGGGTSQAYGFVPFNSSDNLMIDCNSWDMVGSYVDGPTASGNVCAYNYFTNATYDTINPNWDIASISSHDAQSCMNLHEGNWCNKSYIDNDHGSASHITEFRNRYHGKQPSPRNLNTMAYASEGWCRSNNIVGCILGTDGHHTSYWATNAAADENVSIFLLGYDGQPGWGNDIPGSTYIHGNFDFATDSITWDSGNADHTLPASLFLTSKPSWWGFLPWPPYDPTNTTAAALSPTNIPAGYRFIFGTNPPAGPPDESPGASRVRATNLRVTGSIRGN